MWHGCIRREILALTASDQRRWFVGSTTQIPGSAKLHLVDGVALLRPDEQVFTAMIKGWQNQQLERV
ncbi:hypothetical protein AB0L13_09810 [Saccharopolyspora shandongensis]|uniref:hypothetical protein n=1 Tax=Saccharopolyspora shandongensis TaxID=418495 RepID=UPI00341200DD